MYESKKFHFTFLFFIFSGLELRDISCKFLYANGEELNLMDEKTYEELTIPKSVVKESTLNLLEDGMALKLRMAQDKPIGLVLPRITKCTVSEVIESTEGTDKKYNQRNLLYKDLINYIVDIVWLN